ncbi:tRNA dimethylallyltransferase, mitochondrial [Fusarium equiseti]|uniref:tRNA dimethylallyltransferase n=1 Tax=Fusarium equiseti TaxID=61235 RepID=A0ABQ8RH55_FUSEQ|nr:tRNA dimethylallyltransferase, mitochondrial [Fusarium equiseti]
MSAKPPTAPLVVVLGSTGTGKSDLAVELATRLNGEIINADAMQLYNGLPIITNKITTEEQRGIPHHLLGHISLDEQPWDVDDFKREATRTIREIRDRGRLPILVGGSQYYVDPILFKEVILDDLELNTTESFPILQESAEVMLHELRKVDPVMAERWHPKDRRKIQRSLEIYLKSGKRASDYYAEQQARKEAAQQDANKEPWENLLFWVYSQREVLCERLDKRVDKMQTGGLMDEVRELYDFKHKKEAEGQILDMTKGIWQSIGYKQFEPYLAAIDEGQDPAAIEKLKSAGLEKMKAATRQYASYQTRWIRLKQIPRIHEVGPEAMKNMYLLDSTDVSEYGKNVVEPAVQLAQQFLRGEERPLPTEISELAQEVLTQVGNPPPKSTPCKRTCEVCHTTLMTEEAWAAHLKSATHRRVIRKKARTSLVPVEQRKERQKTETKEDEADSGPELGSMFSE